MPRSTFPKRQKTRHNTTLPPCPSYKYIWHSSWSKKLCHDSSWSFAKFLKFKSRLIPQKFLQQRPLEQKYEARAALMTKQFTWVRILKVRVAVLSNELWSNLRIFFWFCQFRCGIKKFAWLILMWVRHAKKFEVSLTSCVRRGERNKLRITGNYWHLAPHNSTPDIKPQYLACTAWDSEKKNIMGLNTRGS